MVTFAELRQAQPQSYRRAALAWASLVAALERQAAVVGGHGTALGSGWSGDAGSAAVRHLERLGSELTNRAEHAVVVPAILADHAARIAGVQAAVHRVLVAVAGTPVQVSASGVVGLSPLVALQPALLPLWLRLAGQVQQVLDRAVAAASGVDAHTTSRLQAAAPNRIGAATERLLTPPAEGIPAPGSDPRLVGRWWRGLTAAQRDRLLASRPGRIGNLDGVPAADRDRANRRVLAEQKARQSRRRAAARNTEELRDIDDKLAGIAAIERRLQDTGPGKQPAYLLGFDVDGRGHAIVAMGNPDTADNVLTYVPGTGARLASIGGDLDRADIMVDAARAADSAETSVAIAWVGYDAPQDIVNTRLGHLGDDATSDQYAMAARDRLDRFQDGLRITHQGARSHNTVLGHSYGSTVVGYTARDRGLDADDVIFVGSPGVGVEHARDLGIPPEHVWSTTARNDPIQYGYDLGDLLEAGLRPETRMDLIHGANPSSPQFGGQVFASDPGDPMVRWEWDHGPLGVPLPKPHFSANAHSQYLDPGSASLINIGQLVVGNRPVRN